jgi:hypothetical protein
MWIKTVIGNYVNSDYVTKIEYENGHTCVKVIGEESSIIIAYDKDVRATIACNIISGVKIVEV